MEQITSRTNPLVVHVRKLRVSKKYRHAWGEVICEGPKMLAEAIQCGVEITTLFYREGVSLPDDVPKTTRCVQVPEGLLEWLSDTETPQGVLFLCRIPAKMLPETLTGSRYLLLDGLQDPGNVGTIWRTADAFGADGLILLPGCADPWSTKTLRATMGACFRLPVWETGIEAAAPRLKRAGVPLWATALTKGARDIATVNLAKAAVVIGSEGRGISDEVLARCENSLIIPMEAHSESLNAAVAAAVVLWQMRRGGAS